MILVGAILLTLGLVSMLTPIPGGVLVIALGAGMIICASPTATNFIKAYRAKNRRFNQILTWLENKIGERLSRPLRMTRPDENHYSHELEGME